MGIPAKTEKLIGKYISSILEYFEAHPSLFSTGQLYHHLLLISSAYKLFFTFQTSMLKVLQWWFFSLKSLNLTKILQYKQTLKLGKRLNFTNAF